MTKGRMMRAGDVWLGNVERASAWFDRMRGLLGRDGLGPGAALLIERCGAVHTVGMRFALDLVFLDRAWRVARVVRGVPRGRLAVCGGRSAVRVLESEAGCVDVARLRVGDVLTWKADE
jgi:uncharacterized membrane protein (UPF0127 family)